MTNASHNTSLHKGSPGSTDDIKENAGTDEQGEQEVSSKINDEATENLTNRWALDANKVHKWLERTEESSEGEKPGQMPEVNWKVLTMLRKEGKQGIN